MPIGALVMGSMRRSSVGKGQLSLLSEVVEQQQSVEGQAILRPHPARGHYHRLLSHRRGKAHLSNMIVQEVRPCQHQGHHINYLNLLAIHLALKVFSSFRAR